jgi:4-amino-4-deoxy-L-arabinose transferase-like glycosyltransferase
VVDLAAHAPREHAAAVTRAERYFVVACLVLVVGALAWRIGAAPVVRSSEQRCYAVVATMLDSGDWLVPIHDGAPRLQKPPLYYWMAAASASAAGGMSRAAERFPSFVCAALLLALVFAWGRSLGGIDVGLLAALILVCHWEFWVLGRRGDAEMLLALTVTAALYAIDRGVFGSLRGWRWPFAIACGVAFLAKATMALLLIGIALAVALTLERRWRTVRARRVAAPFLLASAIALAWYVALLALVPGAIALLTQYALLPLGAADPGDSAGHFEAPWYYLTHVLDVGMPAVLLLPLVAFRAWSTGLRSRPRIRFLVAVLAIDFLALSLLPQKQRHYLLPLLPLYSLVAADALHGLAASPTAAGLRWRPALRTGATLLGVTLTVLVSGYVLLVSGRTLAEAFAVALLCLAPIGLVWLPPPRRIAPGYAAAAATIALFILNFGSFEVWRHHFHEGTVAEQPDFDAAHWEALFTRAPIARLAFHAQHWSAPDRGESAQRTTALRD